MRKIRNSFIFILTVAVIVFCAVLPGVVAKAWDSMSDEKVEYKEIRTVSFQKELNIVDKLLLLSYGLRVPISEESADKTADEIEQLISDETVYYQDCGLLFFPVEECEKKIEPILFLDNESSDVSCIAWLVEIFYGDGESEKVNLWLDDETGKILLISYESFYEVYDKTAFAEYLGVFEAYYLDNLGLPALAKEYVVENNEMAEVLQDKKGGVFSEWSFSDGESGELTLLFYIYSNGFFVSPA